MELNFTPQYKHPLFHWKCAEFASVGFMVLRDYFKTIKDKKYSVKMKSHTFKGETTHYYLEVSIYNRKFIIDNYCCIYEYKEYKERFRPENIETIKVKEIKLIYNQTLTLQKYLHDCIIIVVKSYIEEPKIYDVFGFKMYTRTFFNFDENRLVENKMSQE